MKSHIKCVCVCAGHVFLLCLCLRVCPLWRPSALFPRHEESFRGAHTCRPHTTRTQTQCFCKDNGLAGMLPRSMHVIHIAVPPAVMNTPTRHDAMAENSGGVYGHFSPSRAHPFVGSAAAATTKKNHFPRAGGKLVTFLSHALPCTGWGGGSMVPKVHIWIYLPHL